jgi:hypothetical protein
MPNAWRGDVQPVRQPWEAVTTLRPDAGTGKDDVHLLSSALPNAACAAASTRNIAKLARDHARAAWRTARRSRS